MMDKTISANLVETLIHNLNGHTLLKDVKSAKYLDANSQHLAIYGLNKPQDIQGQTIWDLDKIMNAKWGENAREMQSYDEQVAATAIALTKHKRVWLNANGFVWAHYMNKFPILGTRNNVIAILSFGEDLTASLSLNELYLQYCNLYNQQTKIAINKFLEHINLLSLFNEMPTHSEILILIAKVTLFTNKLIAAELKIKLSTVETHINHLNQKTQNLSFIIELLRKR